MGTVHARVRGPASRGLCDLWAGAAGRRSGGCARGSPGEGAPREAGPGGRRGTGRVDPPAAPRRWAREPGAGEPGRKARPQSCCPRVPQTSEQETLTQSRVVTRPRSLREAVARRGLGTFP